MRSKTICMHSIRKQHKAHSVTLLLLLLCAVKKRMYAKIEPHRARSVTYAMLRNYKKKTAELKIKKK